jgi:putative phosphoribosyl transferase
MQTTKLHRFSNRTDAGRQLAQRLAPFAGIRNVIILAMPRGGVSVAAIVAKALKKPLDVFLMRRLILPNSDDVSFGAITSGGVRMLNHAMLDRMHLSDEVIRAVIFKESIELARREELYRGDHPSLEIADHQVILVDDGFTPSSLLRDAIRLIRRQHPDKVVLALPAAPPNVLRDLGMEVDEVVTVSETDPSIATLGDCFKHLAPATDAEVLGLLGRATAPVEPKPKTRLRNPRAVAYSSMV